MNKDSKFKKLGEGREYQKLVNVSSSDKGQWLRDRNKDDWNQKLLSMQEEESKQYQSLKVPVLS